jgi:tetratricopeptide (TPR) repeat protein
MIVRDAAELLPACLESVRGIVDQIAIVDTGSTDNTIEIARRGGADLISIPWTNDFSEARNQALAQVKTDWVLSLDADEQLDAQAAEQLRPLLEAESVAGYLVKIRNYVLSLGDRIWDRPAKPNDFLHAAARAYPAYVEHENVRLFRHDREIYFEGRVHETVGNRILKTGGQLGNAPFCIHHFGLAAGPTTRERKNRLYRELGRQKIREMPDNAQAHLELGIVELDNFGDLREALARFERACQLAPQYGVAWFFHGLTLLKLERSLEAVKSMTEAERRGHCTSLVAETRGDALYNLKDYGRASQSYELALRRDAGNPILDSKAGLAMVRGGKIEQGLGRIRGALVQRPALAELHDRLIVSLVWLDRIEEAARAAEAKLGTAALTTPGDFLRAASLWAKVKNWPKAGELLQRGLEAYPRNDDLRRGWEEVGQVQGILNLANSMKSTD